MEMKIERLLENVDALIAGETDKETASNTHEVIKHLQSGIRLLDALVVIEEQAEEIRTLKEQLMQDNAAGNETASVELS